MHIGTVAHDRLTHPYIAYLRDVFLMVSVENDRWTTNDFTFDKVMQILVGKVEDSEECIWRKVIDQIEQCQTRNDIVVSRK